MELEALAMELQLNELSERKREGRVEFGFSKRWRRSSLALAMEPR